MKCSSKITKNQAITFQLQLKGHLYALQNMDADNDCEEKIELVSIIAETIAVISEGGLDAPIEDTQKLCIESLLHKACSSIDPELIIETAEVIPEIIKEAISADNREKYVDMLSMALMVRHTTELRLVGLKLLGYSKPPSDEVIKAIEYFDSLIRPMVWGLSLANYVREGQTLLLRHDRRKHYWWWAEGLMVRWETILCVDETVELMIRYDSFKSYFNQLQGMTSHLLDAYNSKLVSEIKEKEKEKEKK